MTRLAGSWAQKQTWVSWDIPETLFLYGQSDCFLTWLWNSPVCRIAISVPVLSKEDVGCFEFRLPQFISEASGRTGEVQVSRSTWGTVAQFWWGVSVGLPRSHAVFLTLSSSSQFGLSVLPVVIVDTFWCLFPLVDVFLFSFWYVTKLLSWL